METKAKDKTPAKYSMELVFWGYANEQYWANNWTKYKLDANAWKRLWETQRGGCAICGVAFAHPRLHVLGKMGVRVQVDHLHVREEQLFISDAKMVRGLLCGSCNMFLKGWKEDLEKMEEQRKRLELALQYLREHGVSEPNRKKEVASTKAPEKFYEAEITELDGSRKIVKVEY